VEGNSRDGSDNAVMIVTQTGKGAEHPKLAVRSGWSRSIFDARHEMTGSDPIKLRMKTTSSSSQT
jgi:hypothetical protein